MTDTTLQARPPSAESTVFAVILAVSFCHLLNDMMQSLFSALYPILQGKYHLDFSQIGLLTLTYQLTASVLQPLIGLFTDRRPMPFSTSIGMGFTLVGLVLLSAADQYALLLVAAAFVGLGSAVFHPESSRVARRFMIRRFRRTYRSVVPHGRRSGPCRDLSHILFLAAKL